MPVTIDGSNTPTAGGVGYGDGTELAFTTAGTAGQVLQSNGAGAPTWAAVPTVNLATGVTGTLPVANGGTGATTLTANNVLLGNGTSAVQFVAPGSNGNVLTSNGTTWTSAAASSGAWTYISTLTATAASSVNLTSGIDSTYGNYQIVMDYLYGSSAGDGLSMRLYYGGVLQTTSYNYNLFGNDTSAGFVGAIRSGNEISFNYNGILYIPSIADRAIKGSMFLINPSQSTLKWNAVQWNLFAPANYNSGANPVVQTGVGFVDISATALTGIRLYGASGTLTTRLHLFGQKTS